MSVVRPTWKHGQVRCAAAVHTRVFDEELVILDLDKGQYFALDRVGTRLWSGLEAGRTLEQIAQEVAAEYDTNLERVLADLVLLGDEMVEQGLLVSETANDR